MNTKRLGVLSALLLALGLLALPVTAYLAAGQVVGPYEGPRGLASYLGAIYGDALSGHAPALIMLFSPCLIALLWVARFLALSQQNGRKTPPPTP